MPLRKLFTEDSSLGTAVALGNSLDLVGVILGIRTLLPSLVEKVFLGLKMTTVSSMVVVKSTNPM